MFYTLILASASAQKTWVLVGLSLLTTTTTTTFGLWQVGDQKGFFLTVVTMLRSQKYGLKQNKASSEFGKWLFFFQWILNILEWLEMFEPKQIQKTIAAPTGIHFSKQYPTISIFVAKYLYTAVQKHQVWNRMVGHARKNHVCADEEFGCQCYEQSADASNCSAQPKWIQYRCWRWCSETTWIHNLRGR